MAKFAHMAHGFSPLLTFIKTLILNVKYVKLNFNDLYIFLFILVRCAVAVN